jgi:hypothetical protein
MTQYVTIQLHTSLIRNRPNAVIFIPNSSHAIHILPSVCRLRECKIGRSLRGFHSFTLRVERVRTYFTSDSRNSCSKSFECIIPCSRGLIAKPITKIRYKLFIATFTRAHHMFLYTNPARAYPSLLNIHFNIVPTSTQIFNRILYVHFFSPTKRHTCSTDVT